jgi:hypothetical protein
MRDLKAGPCHVPCHDFTLAVPGLRGLCDYENTLGLFKATSTRSGAYAAHMHTACVAVVPWVQFALQQTTVTA